MKTTIFFSLLFALSGQICAQKIIENYSAQGQRLKIGLRADEFLPYAEKGYTLILPDTATALKGVLISFEDRKFDYRNNPERQIYPAATGKNFAVLYVSTGIPLDLFFSQKTLLYVDSLIKGVFDSHHLPNKNIVFLGVNLSGHRALKYVAFSEQKSLSFRLDVKGIVLCDGVLDWVRQWYEAKKAIRDNFAQSSVFEGKLVSYLLEQELGGTPKDKLVKYLDFSPYSYFDERNRHLKYYKGLAIRAYTEPATHYWLNNKGKTTFDTNFPDMVGIINELKLAGNAKSELVVFNQDQQNADQRNPNYTWGLVNKADLMTWVIRQTQ